MGPCTSKPKDIRHAEVPRSVRLPPPRDDSKNNNVGTDGGGSGATGSGVFGDVGRVASLRDDNKLNTLKGSGNTDTNTASTATSSAKVTAPLAPPTTSSSTSSSSTKTAAADKKRASTQPPPTSTTPAPEKVERPRDTALALSKADTVIPKTNFRECYGLGKELGKGNYSVVHVATDRATNQKVAVKIMDKKPLNVADIREIKEEVSILADLDHPNIIRLYGFFEDEEMFYIVTELMEGGELFDEIVEREFYWERDAQEVIKMLADALRYMHRKGIVHRDLKPENILLTSKGKDGVVKLADFGFAARIDVNNPEHQLKTACGTPGYVSPEIVAGLRYGIETDVWSLGIITFVLLAGYPPFHDEDVQELFRLIRRGKFSFDPAYWSLVSAEAKSCVKAMMTVDRSQRLTAQGVLEHPWIAVLTKPSASSSDLHNGSSPSASGAAATAAATATSGVLEITIDAVPAVDDVLSSAGAMEAKEAIRRISQTAPILNGGVGGRGLGGEGRGPKGSVNLSPALAVLKKFQARRRWKNDLVMALIREGQAFGGFQDISEVMGESNVDGVPKMKGAGYDTGFKIENEDDLTQLGGLGTSDVLTRLQLEKRSAQAQALMSKG